MQKKSEEAKPGVEPKKPSKVEKPARKPKERAAKAKFYKLDGKKLVRLGQTCPRCGPGVFMADHGNRLACGKCGYTDFKR